MLVYIVRLSLVCWYSASVQSLHCQPNHSLVKICIVWYRREVKLVGIQDTILSKTMQCPRNFIQPGLHTKFMLWVIGNHLFNPHISIQIFFRHGHNSVHWQCSIWCQVVAWVCSWDAKQRLKGRTTIISTGVFNVFGHSKKDFTITSQAESCHVLR